MSGLINIRQNKTHTFVAVPTIDTLQPLYWASNIFFAIVMFCASMYTIVEDLSGKVIRALYLYILKPRFRLINNLILILILILIL